MEEFFRLEPHHWWIIIGTVLLALEVATAGFFLLWPGAAALLMGAWLYLSPTMPLPGQLLLFAALAAALTFLGRTYVQRSGDPIPTDRPDLNDRGAQMVGRTVTAIDAFENGEGRVRVGDGQWRAQVARGDDENIVDSLFDPVEAGDALKVLRVEGMVLIVQRLER